MLAPDSQKWFQLLHAPLGLAQQSWPRSWCLSLYSARASTRRARIASCRHQTRAGRFESTQPSTIGTKRRNNVGVVLEGRPCLGLRDFVVDAAGAADQLVLDGLVLGGHGGGALLDSGGGRLQPPEGSSWYGRRPALPTPRHVVPSSSRLNRRPRPSAKGGANDATLGPRSRRWRERVRSRPSDRRNAHRAGPGPSSTTAGRYRTGGLDSANTVGRFLPDRHLDRVVT